MVFVKMMMNDDDDDDDDDDEKKWFSDFPETLHINSAPKVFFLLFGKL